MATTGNRIEVVRRARINRECPHDGGSAGCPVTDDTAGTEDTAYFSALELSCVEPWGINRRRSDKTFAPNGTYPAGVSMPPLYAVASLAILVAGAFCADDEKVVPAFTPASNGKLAYGSADWQVWIVRDQLESRSRALPFRSRYYLQEFAKPTATLVFEGQNVSARVITVLPDRTILLDGLKRSSTAISRPASVNLCDVLFRWPTAPSSR